MPRSSAVRAERDSRGSPSIAYLGEHRTVFFGTGIPLLADSGLSHRIHCHTHAAQKPMSVRPASSRRIPLRHMLPVRSESSNRWLRAPARGSCSASHEGADRRSRERYAGVVRPRFRASIAVITSSFLARASAAIGPSGLLRYFLNRFQVAHATQSETASYVYLQRASCAPGEFLLVFIESRRLFAVTERGVKDAYQSIESPCSINARQHLWSNLILFYFDNFVLYSQKEGPGPRNCRYF